MRTLNLQSLAKATRPRSAMPTAPEHLVAFAPLRPDGPLPLVGRPTTSGVDLRWWAERHRDLIEERLLTHGAILFRGFDIAAAGDFHGVVEACCSRVLPYRERSSPRTQVSEDVYTSTDHPASEWIFPHNELSYAKTFPRKLFFFCETPATSGGETPLADTRQVRARIDPAIYTALVQRGWSYVRNLGVGFGLPWQTVFQTDDRGTVEAYCREHSIEWEWLGPDLLRTRQVRPVLATHPCTGEAVWFNHLAFFHVSTLDARTRAAITAAFANVDLPNNTYYGDGSAVADDIVENLRRAYLESLVSFTWERGDVIVLDNLLTAHSRSPYTGARRILFAMGDPVTRTDLDRHPGGLIDA